MGSFKTIVGKKKSRLIALVAAGLISLLFMNSLLRAELRQTPPLAPNVTVSKFYSWYFHAIEANNDPANDNPIMQQYISTELLHQLDRLDQLRELDATIGLTDDQYRELESDELTLDSEYFTKAQDCFEDWTDNINVSSPQLSDDKANVIVTSKGFPQNNCPLNLSVNLVKENNLWKIRSVKSAAKK